VIIYSNPAAAGTGPGYTLRTAAGGLRRPRGPMPMRQSRPLRFTIISLLTTLGLAAGGGCTQRPAGGGPELPLHYFLADAGGGSESVQCDFGENLDREERFSIWGKPLEPCAIGYGWTQPSPKGIKAFGKRSSLEVFARATDFDLLILTLRAFRRHGMERPQTMRVFLNGRKIDTREIPDSWTTVAIEIPKDRLRLGSNAISFSFDHYASTNTPGKKEKKDHRRVAAEFRTLALERADGGEPPPGEVQLLLRRAVRPSKPRRRLFDRETRRYRVDQPGTLVLPMEISGSSESLSIEMIAGPNLDIDRTEVLATIVNLSSGEAWAPALPGWRRGNDNQTRMAAGAIPIRRCAGSPCMVALKIHPRPAGAAIEIAQPRQITGGDERTPELGPHDATGRQAEDRPDIVFIILDAARADHFSTYGYHRLTTPNIDRLAREARVFHNVFALAPFTLCSVPTMVTGLSFLDHGVTQRGRTLSPEIFTLAEQLREAGYHTIAFSTNPNNSRATGTDQGYDEFFELWTEIKGRASADPRFITERALETLAEIDDSRPLHLLLHYMPPHAPYNPAPEFDVFSDPDYDGPCDGSFATINGLDVGRRAPGNGCLDELIAHYDGNLFAADYWVGQLLDVLRARPRWKDTVVLVTSDHGEGFLEHGRTGHNKTVYDEMLRVPFILRLPEEFEDRTSSSDRMATLEDIVPTLLATASLTPAAPLGGVNLLDAETREPRYFIARTAHIRPTYALRTGRWKVILPASGHGMLFDLAADPGELANLGFRRRPEFVALGQLLTWKLADRSTETERPPTAELPEEDRKMLKALGYVE